MIFPVGVISWIGLAAILRDGGRTGHARLAWTGFLSLIVSVAAFQLMLDRGERADWFDSMAIVICAAVAALGLYIRSDERRGGKESVGTCRSRGSPLHSKK